MEPAGGDSKEGNPEESKLGDEGEGGRGDGGGGGGSNGGGGGGGDTTTAAAAAATSTCGGTSDKVASADGGTRSHSAHDDDEVRRVTAVATATVSTASASKPALATPSHAAAGAGGGGGGMDSPYPPPSLRSSSPRMRSGTATPGGSRLGTTTRGGRGNASGCATLPPLADNTTLGATAGGSGSAPRKTGELSGLSDAQRSGVTSRHDALAAALAECYGGGDDDEAFATGSSSRGGGRGGGGAGSSGSSSSKGARALQAASDALRDLVEYCVQCANTLTGGGGGSGGGGGGGGGKAASTRGGEAAAAVLHHALQVAQCASVRDAAGAAGVGSRTLGGHAWESERRGYIALIMSTQAAGEVAAGRPHYAARLLSVAVEWAASRGPERLPSRLALQLSHAAALSASGEHARALTVCRTVVADATAAVPAAAAAADDGTARAGPTVPVLCLAALRVVAEYNVAVQLEFMHRHEDALPAYDVVVAACTRVQEAAARLPRGEAAGAADLPLLLAQVSAAATQATSAAAALRRAAAAVSAARRAGLPPPSATPSSGGGGGGGGSVHGAEKLGRSPFRRYVNTRPATAQAALLRSTGGSSSGSGGSGHRLGTSGRSDGTAAGGGGVAGGGKAGTPPVSPRSGMPPRRPAHTSHGVRPPASRAGRRVGGAPSPGGDGGGGAASPYSQPQELYAPAPPGRPMSARSAAWPPRIEEMEALGGDDDGGSPVAGTPGGSGGSAGGARGGSGSGGGTPKPGERLAPSRPPPREPTALEVAALADRPVTPVLIGGAPRAVSAYSLSRQPASGSVGGPGGGDGDALRPVSSVGEVDDIPVDESSGVDVSTELPPSAIPAYPSRPLTASHGRRR